VFVIPLFDFVIAGDSAAISSLMLIGFAYRHCTVRDCFVPRNDI